MKTKDIRNLKNDQLEQELEKFQREFTQANKEIKEGKEKNVKKSLRIKRIIARIQTVLNENKLKENNNGEREEK